MAANGLPEKPKSQNVFGQARKPTKMFRAGLYARVSTNDQQTLPMQIRALREYAARRGWTIALQVSEVGSGAVERQAARETAGSGAPPRNRCGAGVAAGSLGTVSDGSTGNPAGTGASRRRFRLADGGAGSDHARRSRNGRAAGHLCGVRTGDSARTHARWPGPCPAERQTPGPADQLRGGTLPRSANCIVPASAKAEIARRLQIGRTSVRRILDQPAARVGI